MIISHRFKYLFIEVPLTASWSIHNELCEYYDGKAILHKHASYPEFCREASEGEFDYFVFATVRNPLDMLVSGYFKLKGDHKGAFSRPESLKALKIDYSDVKKYNFIKNTNASFEQFFVKYNRRPYSNMIDLSADYLDYFIRFENLQKDFSGILNYLGVDQKRPLPVSNRTPGRLNDWKSYYTPEVIERAKKVCGPFMNRWGYEFPAEWGDYNVSKVRELEYILYCFLKKLYLIHFRYNDRYYSKLLRYLRAKLLN